MEVQEERQLLAELRANDEGAFEQVVQRHQLR